MHCHCEIYLQDKNDSNHVIHIVDSFEFRGHLCICFELLSHNLYEFMRLQDFKRLNMQLVHKLASQLIHTLCFLKQEGVIHCDLKPENILLQNCHYSAIKVLYNHAVSVLCPHHIMLMPFCL